MKSYHEGTTFKPEMLAYLERATEIVARIPETQLSQEAAKRIGNATFRCHELTRVVAKILHLDFVDGVYGAVDHSWILIPDIRNGWISSVILDVYAVGRLPMVQLVDPRVPGLHNLYKMRDQRTDIDEVTVRELGVKLSLIQEAKAYWQGKEL